MQDFQIQYNFSKRTTWLLSFGVFVFAVLNSGYNDNLFTALQEAVQTEWLASDNDIVQNAIWQVGTTPSNHVSLPEVASLSDIDSYNRLVLIAYKVAELECLNYCNNQNIQSDCRYHARRSIKDNDDISTLG